MHTFQHRVWHDRKHSTDHTDWTIHHNGDFSGDVILAPPDVVRQHGGVAVPYEVIEAIVMKKVLDDRISRLEQATTLEEVIRG